MSSTPLYTTRIEPAVKRLLPPASSSGAASNITTLAPCSCAASAAQNAALPPPTTITSYSDIVPPTEPPSAVHPRGSGDPVFLRPIYLPWIPACAGTNGEWLAIRSILHHAPLDRFATAIDQRLLVRPLDLDLRGGGPGGSLERDGFAVGWQLVVAGAVEGGKCLELVERAFLLEHLGVARDRDRRIEQARDAVDRKLPGDRVWR